MNKKSLLELVGCTLPFSAELDSHLDASELIFDAALKVYP